MSAHLSGWRISAGDEHLIFDASGNVLAVVSCGGMYRRSFDEAADVARLITAAPDLLAALEAAVECGMVPKSSAREGGATAHARMVHVADEIRAAIAKAKGENQ